MHNKTYNWLRPRGFTYLELEVSFLLFAIALSGLAPLAVMQSRQVRTTETRLDADDTHYFNPSSNPWARKLGAGAALSVNPPFPSSEVVLLIDDGDVGYSEANPGGNGWTPASPAAAFAGDLRLSGPSLPGDEALWQFTNLQPGPYEVLVTYQPYAGAATNARYRAYDDVTEALNVRIDQQTNPAGPVYAGVAWESLGTLTVGGTNVLVKLDDDAADGDIVADAVRLVWRGNHVQIDSFNKSTDSETVSADVTVTAPSP